MAGRSGARGAPPGWLVRLAGWFLPEADREVVLGDLEERYRRRAASGRSRSGAVWRYAVEAMASGRELRLERRRSRARVSGPPNRRGDGPGHATLSDLRHALRGLVREPGFALVAVITLAVGTGATSAIYGVASPVLFRSLPYPAADRLVMIWEEESAGTASNVGYATYADIERDSRTLESTAAMAYWSPTLTGEGHPEQLTGQSVTAGFFRTLGVGPAMGRDFEAAEDVPGANAVVILSHGLWQRRFGGDPGIIGRTVLLSFRPYEVIGVLPVEYESLLAPEAELFRPLGYDESLTWACRSCRHLRAVARVRADRSLADAERELDGLSGTYASAYPTEYDGPGMVLVPLKEQLVHGVRPALLVVLGAAALVLLIASANVLNLLLARSLRRQPEFAVRAALGASRGRVIRQLLTESLLLGAAGGAAGLLVAYWGARTLVALGPADIPRLSVVGIDLRVVAFTALVTTGISAALGILPALMTDRAGLLRGIGHGQRATSTRAGSVLRGGLVVAEVALALSLTVGAGLLVRSLDRLLEVDTGFDPGGILTVDVLASGPKYAENSAVLAMQDRLIETVASVPGVESAALTSQVPLGGNFDRWGVRIEDKPLVNPALAPGADRYSVTANYLVTMGIAVLSGRGFTTADRAGAQSVVLINRTFAERWWPGEDPLGARVQLGASDSPWRTVVGVVADVQHTGLDAERAPQIYMPLSQSPQADNAVVLVARTSVEPERVETAVQEAVWSVDSDLAIGRVAPATELVRAAAARRRFALQIFGAFASVALLLACIGIYGVLSGSVAERVREIGVRTALGASRGSVLRLVVGYGMRMAGFGMLLGLGVAFFLTRLLRGLLFEVQPYDPATLVAVCAILSGVALTACAAPAWRAARVDPMRALRE